jgi:hypothetical protein
VKSITPDSAASKSKLLMEGNSCFFCIIRSFRFFLGDKILEVNGSSLVRVTHTEAVELFRRATGPKCHLLVQRLIFPNNSRAPSIISVYPFARPGEI